MDTIIELFKMDIPSVVIGLFMIMAAIIAMVEIIGKFSNIIGKPVKWVQKKNEDHELLMRTAKGLDELNKRHDESVEQSIRHDKIIRDDLTSVSDKVDAVSAQITNMQKKIDDTEMAKLKDTLISYYRKYKDIGEWTQLESDAFWDLFRSYESHGGNGFMHSTVEPVMRELRIVE